jgi:hypothetical protein
LSIFTLAAAFATEHDLVKQAICRRWVYFVHSTGMVIDLRSVFIQRVIFQPSLRIPLYP